MLRKMLPRDTATYSSDHVLGHAIHLGGIPVGCIGSPNGKNISVGEFGSRVSHPEQKRPVPLFVLHVFKRRCPPQVFNPVIGSIVIVVRDLVPVRRRITQECQRYKTVDVDVVLPALIGKPNTEIPRVD